MQLYQMANRGKTILKKPQEESRGVDGVREQTRRAESGKSVKLGLRDARLSR